MRDQRRLARAKQQSDDASPISEQVPGIEKHREQQDNGEPECGGSTVEQDPLSIEPFFIKIGNA